MIKQALNAPAIAEAMRRFVKDDAIKLLGKSTYNKWVKKLPSDSIANNLRLKNNRNSMGELQWREDLLRLDEADRLDRTQDVSNALMYRYGPSFEANLPRVNERLDTRGRLKGAVLKRVPRVNYLREFANRNNLVSRNDLLQWNRRFDAGLDPKTLTSEWYVKPTGIWTEEKDATDILRKPKRKPDKIFYNGKMIPEDMAYRRAQLVRNIAAVPYTDLIRHTAEQLVANELRASLDGAVARRSVYNSVSDNTRKVLDYVNGRNMLEDPRAERLIAAAVKHGRLDIEDYGTFKNGNNAAFLAVPNVIAVHPRLTQKVKNHERSHFLLHNMDAQQHADIASRVFRGINAISRKNPEYSNLSKRLIDLPNEAHEAVTDYYRHKLYGTLSSRVDDYKSMDLLNTSDRFSEPRIHHVVSETQNLTSNPKLQQALQQLALNYDVALRNI